MTTTQEHLEEIREVCFTKPELGMLPYTALGIAGHHAVAALALLGNRWAAFTKTELHETRAGLDMLWQEHRKSPDAQRIWDELTAELERRNP